MARITASINMTKLRQALINDPTLIAFKSKTGDAYVNINIWINADLDDYNNDTSIQLAAPKDHAKLEPSIYLGNGKSDAAWDEIKRREDVSKSKLSYQRPKQNIPTNVTNDVPVEFTPAQVVESDDLPF